MVEQVTPRRLSTILVADVVGFSRLVELDEAATIAAMKARWSNILEPLVGSHGGRIAKYMGDGVLVEFQSAVRAVQCGLAIQECMAQANAREPGEVQIALRIGVNLGDVVVDGTDLLGDDVNIASRLEPLSRPGELCISASVFDAIQGKLGVNFEDLGEPELKNISRRVRAYRVASSADVATPGAQSERRADILSIAVLPFDNMSGDPGQDYIGDMISENIMTELARFRDLTVIARNSTFVYKGKATRVQDIRRDVGANYILAGSVQKAGERIRITTQLVNGESGKHLWAERYDRRLDDLFAVIDEITDLIVGSLGTTYGGRLRKEASEAAVRAGPTSNRAFDHFAKALSELSKYTKESIKRSFAHFDRATALDPRYAKAYAKLSIAHLLLVNFGWSDDVELSKRTAREAARAAMAADPSEAWAYWAAADCDVFDGQHRRALAAMTRAIELNPHDADLVMEMALFKSWAGMPEEALDIASKALLLNPHYPEYYHDYLGAIYFDNRRYEDAIRVLSAIPTMSYPPIIFNLAASYAGAGRIPEAKATIKKLLEDEPQSTISYWTSPSVTPYAAPEYREHLAYCLRLAGLPE